MTYPLKMLDTKWTKELVRELILPNLFLSENLPGNMKWKNWRTLNVMVFDLESCGLNPFDIENRIVQFCGIVFRNGIETKRLNLYINPQKKIPEDATAVHGISTEMVIAEDNFAESWPKMMDFMEDVDLIVGHNILNYDIPLLQNQCRVYKQPIPNMPALDTIVFFRDVKGKLSGVSNEAMGIHYRVAKTSAVKHGLAKAHDAEVDVEMTAGSLFKMGESDIPYCLRDALRRQETLFCRQTAYLMNQYRGKRGSSNYSWIDFPSPFSKSYWREWAQLMNEVEE
jgi:DNA polymerase-3 subunit epsilon